MGTTFIGRLGEAKVISRLVELGYYPYVDISGKSPIDILAYKDGVVFKISVKTTTVYTGSSYIISLKESRHNKTTNKINKFDSSKYDYLGGYIVDLDKVVFIPCCNINNTSAIAISLKNRKNGNFIDDFTII